MPPDVPDRLLRTISDFELCCRISDGCQVSFEEMLRRYRGFIRLKVSSYFLVGGQTQDLLQEAQWGFYKACKEFRPDCGSSFRNFADLCVTRQIITAVKTATRHKHEPLNQYVSFSKVVGSVDSDATLEEVLAGPENNEPLSRVMAYQELRNLVNLLSTDLSEFESRVLAGYLAGNTYEVIAQDLGCGTKNVDNALQRVKRKINTYRIRRDVLNMPLAA